MHPDSLEQAFIDRIPQVNHIQLFISMSRDLLKEVEKHESVLQ